MAVSTGRSMRMALALGLSAVPALAVVAAAQQAPSAPVDSARPGLSAFVESASAVNSRIPEGLRAYRAVVETEISMAIVDSAGLERIVQLEQVTSDVRWRAPNAYDQRVIGYRSQTVAPAFSLLSIFGGWTTPTLYGNSLQLGVSPVASRQPRTRGVRLAIHPLANNRRWYYEFAGGDTVAVVQARERRIPVVSLRVEPRDSVPGSAILFLGEMHLDADRRQIVRMRGRMVEYSGGRPTISAGSRVPGASGASYVEMVNAEFGGEYWLPTYQRTELQAHFALFGNLRTIVRIVSRFRDHRLNDSTWSAGPDAPPDIAHNLTFAPSDSLSRYDDWQRPLGAASDDVRFSDFNDLAPDAWESEGDHRLRFRPRSMAEVFRFNRIEGAFTGIALERDFRDRGEGLLVRGSAGWAWAERTARGAVSAERRGFLWSQGLRLERTLAHTNDFTQPLSWGATLSALLGSTDDFDYVDRWSATASLSRSLDAQRRSFLRFEAGPGRDRAVEQHASRGLYVEGRGFRPNRGIREGDYFRTAASIELNPQVSGMFVNRGVGARLQYERADGGLRWQRVEARVTARRNVGPIEVFARGDAGTLLGAPVPQALFEIGRWEGLRAYRYKEFGGDRAAIGRVAAGYTGPWLRAPIRLPSMLVIPGLAPGLAAGVQAGWAEASGEAARRALLALGTEVDTLTGMLVPLSRPTDGVRASGELLFTFFNGAVGLGVARTLDQPGPWRFTGRIGQGF